MIMTMMALNANWRIIKQYMYSHSHFILGNVILIKTGIFSVCLTGSSTVSSLILKKIINEISHF